MVPKKKLNILFVSSEVVPFAKTGGLADVSAALPKRLKQLGHDVRIIMPKYGTIKEAKYKLREVIRLRDIDVLLGEEIHQVSIKSAFIPNSKVQVYFMEHADFFNREGFYTNPKTKKDYPDNDARFLLFSRGILEISKILCWRPDIIHCNDWQTATIPLLLKTVYRDDEFFENTKTVLSIHNLEYQGNFAPSAVKLSGLPANMFYSMSPIEFFNHFSFLKAGIHYSDIITTVSETYAREIQSDPEYGCGMEGILHDRRDDLFGILNGIDNQIWDPEKDNLIARNYNAGDLNDKIENKKVLLELSGLKFDPSVPVIGIISRLTDQKGFDLIKKVINKIAALDLQFVVLGQAHTKDEKKYEKLFRDAAKKYPNKFAAHFTFNDQLAHMIEAGCDIFLMPSRFEPCGLNQMYSLRYGTIPVVRSTGGLADTIFDVTKDSKNGNGFVFDAYDADEMLDAIKRAVNYFKNNSQWQKLQHRGMKQNFTWEKSAKKYVEIYELALKNPKRPH